MHTRLQNRPCVRVAVKGIAEVALRDLRGEAAESRLVDPKVIEQVEGVKDWVDQARQLRIGPPDGVEAPIQQFRPRVHLLNEANDVVIAHGGHFLVERHRHGTTRLALLPPRRLASVLRHLSLSWSRGLVCGRQLHGAVRRSCGLEGHARSQRTGGVHTQAFQQLFVLAVEFEIATFRILLVHRLQDADQLDRAIGCFPADGQGDQRVQSLESQPALLDACRPSIVPHHVGDADGLPCPQAMSSGEIVGRAHAALA
mmetsp:Transcript_73601/g.213205  ORF Transcript_73601/g.213205 Transcript_73601/m.213205 type:complete len:256 (+) Transcript_73601:1868-2635(+)